ncbi:MAG TPA: penicillin-binding protein 2, partial [Acidimicrobiales bacterium]|nr:penicillin-binding protein 2 [Acidimicrobiales bacterium]
RAASTGARSVSARSPAVARTGARSTSAGPRRVPAARRAGGVRRAPTADPRKRLTALLVVLAVALAAVAVRLWMVQGPGGRHYADLGREQRVRSAVLPAERGAIVDRNGVELAMSTRRRTVWADPRSVRDPAAAARALAPLLRQSEPSLRQRLTTNGGFVYLARKVEDPVADAVAALAIPGVGLLDEPKRVDPAGALAAPVLGQVGLDDEGLSGLELQYEKELAGRDGTLLVEKDPSGNDIASGVHELRSASRGDQLVLTIDRAMQFETERVLADQIVASRAKGGIALVMDPRTGEILAMANLVAGAAGSPPVPSPDNMAVTRVYEPGSVNKMITVSAALEEKVVRPSDTFVVPDRMGVADALFHDSSPHATEVMTVERILAESSNVGTIMIGQRLGKTHLDSYLRAFGLADRTSLAFPGEAKGILPRPDEWSGTSIATLPIGQGVAVTALQMLSAYNTIANGGVYVSPSLVTRVVGADGEVRPVRRPEPRRVVSEETARAVTAMLEQVVTDGTGTAAAVPGYRVAGKTGTASKPREGGVGYEAGAYVASFAGFLPAGGPRLSAIVILDEPTPYYGGLVAAPVFSQLAGYGVRLLAVPPDTPRPPASALPGATTLGRTPTRP